MDYLVKIRSVQTPLNGQFSIGANNLALNSHYNEQSQDPPHHVRVRPHQGGQSNHSGSHLLKLELLRRVK